ncbi:outer membrane protein assembly factor BamB [Jeongeupia naejangsanensis]|uniref:Outer membrane protein assembly factor BamB n=1 Tax=Jeongeupia naejangsanensis TaxID=613195 RepID=A0ABS2BGU1_9NEIS|nr:outer membrane protein assembly factor BamB [Jeongeupia naejangsanensis]MBM3114840.1 outer membrane protein assembly factor BamB [Jeongeupia naejangsanensis]
MKSKLLVAAPLALLLAACGSISNAPTPSPLPVVENKAGLSQVWHASVGGDTSFRFQPAQAGDRLIVAGAPDRLTALSLANGASQWQVKLDKPLAGGVGAGEGLIAVGTLKGEVVTYSYDGKAMWHAQLSSEIVSPPAITDGIVLVRTVDGKISGLSAVDGALKWQFQRQMPALILRNYAPMTLRGGIALAGLAGGRMVALGAQDGRVLWDSPVAMPKGATELERIADVVSAPEVNGNMVCAAAYQGRVSCFNVLNGSPVWSREVSSYAGVAGNGRVLAVTDSDGNVLGYDRNSGRSLWKQDKLVARSVGSPEMLGDYVAVADYEGYVHLLKSDDGSLVGQLATDGSRIAAEPVVFDNKLIVQSQSGDVFALTVK